ncbi:hypothetical protein MNBD_ALPHA12-800 [hydrothermal vent metagenome]|uniref:Uncharacterized protein n=1 Tax=hydrothermal vent metagenome TaxID=652676 RepID=A0A3B0U827_9ZZZZ
MSNDQTNIAQNPSATIIGYGISYSITSIFSALLVILKESNASVQGLLVALTGHHWVTHGLLNLILFVVLGIVLSRREIDMNGDTLTNLVVGATVLGGLIIASFFLFL